MVPYGSLLWSLKLNPSTRTQVGKALSGFEGASYRTLNPKPQALAWFTEVLSG